MGQQTKYLNRLRHIVGSRQSAEIIAKLGLEKDDGNIQTLTQMRDKLNKLLPKIGERNLAPLSKMSKMVEEDKIDDALINDHLLFLAIDLLTLFEENDNVNDILNSQQEIMLRSISKDLKKAIKRIRGELEIHELFAQLNQTQSQSFGGARAQTQEGEFVFASRTDRRTKNLYLDRETGDVLSQEFDCSIGGSDYLLLPIKSNIVHRPRTARVVIEDSSPRATQASEFSVDLSELGPENTIDMKKDTYWARSVLLTAPKTTDNTDSRYQGVLHKLEIQFDNLVTFNYITVEPILSSEVYIVALEGFKNGTWSVLWQSTGYNGGIRLIGDRTLYFKNSEATAIRLTFESRSFKTVSFLSNETSGNEKSSLSELLFNEFSSSVAKEILGAQEDIIQSREYAEYFIGIDNIYVGLGTLRDKGIFVSRPATFERASIIGVSTDWMIPYRQLSSVDVSFSESAEDDFPDSTGIEVLGVPELYMVKWDYADKDMKTLIRQVFFPIIPLYRNRRVFERLLLTDKSSSGSPINEIGNLRFLAEDIDDVLIFRDGDPLTKGVDWTEYTTGTQDSINIGEPMYHSIKITAPLRESSYMVVYTVKASNIEGKPQFDGSNWVVDSTLLTYNDVLGDTTVTLDSQGFYHFDNEVDRIKIEKSEVSLVVMMRNNAKGRFPGITPILKNYRIIAIEAPSEQ